MSTYNHYFSMNINGRLARISTVSKRKEEELLHSGIQNAIKFGLVSAGTYGRYDTKSWYLISVVYYQIDTNRDLDLKLHFSIRSLKESTTDILIDRILESVRYVIWFYTRKLIYTLYCAISFIQSVTYLMLNASYREYAKQCNKSSSPNKLWWDDQQWIRTKEMLQVLLSVDTCYL